MPQPRIPSNSRLNSTDPPCGVSAHPEDCLCDVVVVTPTKIARRISPETFWGMKMAFDAGYGHETDEEILKLFEALALAKDAAVNLQNFDRFDSRGKLRASSELREKILQFLKEGNSIVDAPRTFKESWGNCLASITAGNTSAVWSWSEKFWAQIEDFIMEHDEWCGYRALMREFNIDRGPATVVERLYRDAVKNESAPALAYAREMYINSPRASRKWIHKKLSQRGYSLTDDQLRQVRTRLREAGLVPDRTVTVGEWREQQD